MFGISMPAVAAAASAAAAKKSGGDSLPVLLGSLTHNPATGRFSGSGGNGNGNGSGDTNDDGDTNGIIFFFCIVTIQYSFIRDMCIQEQ